MKLNARLISLILGWVLFLSMAVALQAKKAEFGRDDDGVISLQEVGRNLGFKPKVVDPLKRVRLSGSGGECVFAVHKRDVVLNGTRVYLGSPVELKGRHLYISTIDYEKTIRPLLAPQTCTKQPLPPLQRILLDPGHGGKDSGAEHFGLKEKNLTLDLAKRVKRQLEAKGFAVSLTRDKDVYLELKERVQQVAQKNAQLFVSLHFNAAAAASVTGAETYVLTPKGQASTGKELSADDFKAYPGNAFDIPSAWLGYSIQTALIKNMPGLHDRGLRRARFLVLKELTCPGVLVEGGFLTNKDEAECLKDQNCLESLAVSIAKGIEAYAVGLTRLQGSGVSNK